MVTETKPECVFLSETKIQVTKMVNVVLSCGFSNYEIVPATRKAGGLCLCWNNTCNIQIMASTKSFIAAKIIGISHVDPWLLVGVYIPAVKAKQTPVLHSISSTLDAMMLPSVVIGDFNNHVHQDEKRGGRPSSWAEMGPFIEFVDDNGLIDIGFSGNPFTWSNRQSFHKDIRIRLDRGLVNTEWRSLFPKASINHLAKIRSDHSPMIMNLKGDKARGAKPFKFEQFWTRDDSSAVIVQKAWSIYVSGSPPSRFCRKLYNTKVALRRWNRDTFGNFIVQAKTLTKQISDIQLLPRTDVSAEKETLLCTALEEARTREDIMWRQKSRVEWRMNGDRATKFFFLSTVINRRRNSIERLEDATGMWLSKRKLIGNSFLEYYRLLFSSSLPDSPANLNGLIQPVISAEQNSKLIKLPSAREIKDTLFAMGSTKAPGPDGFSTLFFKTYWSTVGIDVIRIVHDFFRKGSMFNELNHNFVTLIPKIKAPCRVEHYRPISLCNVGYKIISKILANRLKETLDDVISPLQAAFIPGRTISDNIILTQEIMFKFKKKKGKTPLMAIKYDMSKAYDRVEWDFLEKVLTLFGYHRDFVHLIMECVSSTSMSFLINGKPYGFLKPKRGLRQGDPISAYLFLLCGEILSRMLSNLENENLLKGIKIGNRCTPITHLMFADDLICFSEASNTNFDAIKGALSKYAAWSGQEVNNSKSGIIFSKNTTTDLQVAMGYYTGIKPMSESSFYLGQPISLGRSKVEAFKFIVDKLLARVAGWKSKVLSFAGRETLIASVLSAMPSYTMLHFDIPITITNLMDGCIRKFWWNHEQNSAHKMCPLAWEKICKPKSEGGLGFRSMKNLNNALLTKLAWSVVSNEKKLWVSQCIQKYCKTNDFMSISDKHYNGSPIWQAILKARKFLKPGLCFLVGNGMNIKAHQDPWIPGVTDFRPVRRIGQGNQYMKVADYIQSPIQEWNRDLLNKNFDDTSVREILKIKLSSRCPSDKVMWTPNKNGIFTVKSGYITNLPQVNWFRSNKEKEVIERIWSSNLHNRQKVFLWRVTRGALLTRTKLNNRIPSIDKVCPICNLWDETEIHLFLFCDLARTIWWITWGIRTDTLGVTSKEELVDFIISPASVPSGEEKRDIFRMWGITLLEQVWKIRNNLIWDANAINPTINIVDNRPNEAFLSLQVNINNLAKEACTPSKKVAKKKNKPPLSQGLPPPRGVVKIHCDVARQDSILVSACIAKDYSSCIVAQSHNAHDNNDPVIVEAIAVLEATSLALRMKWSHCIFESSSPIVSSNLLGGISSYWKIDNIIDDIKLRASNFPNWSFVKGQRGHIGTFAGLQSRERTKFFG